MDKHKFLKLLDKQANGDTSPEEDELIFKLFDEAQKSDAYPFQNNEEEFLSKAKMLSSINKVIDSEVPAKKQINRKVFLNAMKYAAVLFLIAAISIFFFQRIGEIPNSNMIAKATNQEQKATITLSDGTKVHLNVLSEIRFPEVFDKDNRTVEVKGEAFFEVAKDTKRPFLVQSNGVTTKVLGTSFNINSYNGDDVVVAVKTGSVQVSSAEDSEKKVILSPNQKAIFKRAQKEFTVEEIDINYYLDWRNRTIAFNLESLDQVFNRLARVYNLEIELVGFDGSCAIKASFPNNNLYSVLYGLENLVDFEYVWKGEKKLRVIYKGCKN
ncbi:putative anti-sigma factor [Indibacter alkaliphilus LW1]|uniref:Anti-sigma factor n=1 Tax=Indibacter alkaliphilus (strain CCUG 57479 / KCTC 22604 / LW1) TaxID=1189612 RepID=S2D399_INDAL|nr:FecR domain-containing protein [Indibacter alkaliphilus]EOZ91500.1 putative anti-sigma factor [Indibacter alkaliphilus LW1]